MLAPSPVMPVMSYDLRPAQHSSARDLPPKLPDQLCTCLHQILSPGPGRERFGKARTMMGWAAQTYVRQVSLLGLLIVSSLEAGEERMKGALSQVLWLGCPWVGCSCSFLPGT